LKKIPTLFPSEKENYQAMSFRRKIKKGGREKREYLKEKGR
jgi:hypothetical protein